MDEKSARLYANLNSYKHLVNKTRGFIRWALNRVESPYVACSFGKDSSVMLHLVLQEVTDIPVRFVRWKKESELLNNYDDVIYAWDSAYGINLEQVELSRASLNDKVVDRYKTVGYDSFFIGLRSNESTARRITLQRHGMFYNMKSGIVRISPMKDWTTDDVHAYIEENQLPTLASYTSHGMDSRTSSRVPREDFGIRSQSITQLKERDISAYNQLCEFFPEIKEY